MARACPSIHSACSTASKTNVRYAFTSYVKLRATPHHSSGYSSKPRNLTAIFFDRQGRAATFHIRETHSRGAWNDDSFEHALVGDGVRGGVARSSRGLLDGLERRERRGQPRGQRQRYWHEWQ